MKKGWVWSGEGEQERKRWDLLPHLIRGLPEYLKPPTLCGGTGPSSKSERGYPAHVFCSTHPLPSGAVPFPFLTPKSVDAAAKDNCRQEGKWDMHMDVNSPHPNCCMSAHSEDNHSNSYPVPEE